MRLNGPTPGTCAIALSALLCALGSPALTADGPDTPAVAPPAPGPDLPAPDPSGPGEVPALAEGSSEAGTSRPRRKLSSSPRNATPPRSAPSRSARRTPASC